MRVISIKFHNVFRFGETDNVLNMDDVFAMSDDDIALITGSIDGDDNDSNGAGKSTIGEGLYWALFEKIPRLTRNSDRKGTAVAEVIRTDDNNEIAPGIKQSYVEVHFETGDGRKWRLKRGRKITRSGNHSPILELDCDGVPVAGNKNEKMANILGAGSDSVLNSIFFAQMDTGKFLSGTDRARRDILMDLRGLMVVDRMLKVLRDEYKKGATKAHDELVVRADIIRARLDGVNDAELRKEKLEAAKNLEGVDDQVAEKEMIISDLEKSEVKTTANSIGKRFATLETELQSVKREKESALVDLRAVVSDTLAKVKEGEMVLNTSIAGEKKSLDKKFIEAKGVLDGHDEKSIQDRTEAIASAKSNMESVNDDLQKNSAELSVAIDNRAMADATVSMCDRELKKFSDLRGADECPTCGNKWSDDEMSVKIAQLEEDLRVAVSAQGEKVIVVNELTDKERRINEKIKKISSILQDEVSLTADIERLKAARGTIQSCKERAVEVKANEERTINEIHALKARIEKTSVRLKEREAEYEERELKMTSLVAECRKEMDGVTAEANKIDCQISSLRNEIADLQNSKAEVAATIGRIDEKLEARKKDVEQMVSIKAGIKREKISLDRISYLETTLANNIKNDIAESCIPLLNFYTNEFLAILRDGMRVEIMSDGKNIPIRLIGSTASSYNMLSGGEQSALRLAVSMALSMISIGSAADLPDMIFLDEIFGALDSKTRDNVFRLLRRLKKNFERIIVITHDQMIKERFQTKIHIDKKDGISRLTT
jgi:exonuclease SbcC